jgi:hypothetical protein
VGSIDNTNDLIVTYVAGLGNWLGLATGIPGNTAAPANEAVGGSPAYARQETTWTVSGSTAIGSPVTFNVGPGTYTYLLACSGSSGSNMVSWTPIQPQTKSVQATITITPIINAS